MMTRRHKIALHESAHAVVATATGHKVMRMAVGRSAGAHGYFLWLCSCPEPAAWHCFGVVASAGVVASPILLKRAQMGIRGDVRDIRECLSHLGNDPRKQWYKAARDIVLRERRTIEKLAKLFLARRTMNAVELAHLLKQVRKMKSY